MAEAWVDITDKISGDRFAAQDANEMLQRDLHCKEQNEEDTDDHEGLIFGTLFY